MTPAMVGRSRNSEDDDEGDQRSGRGWVAPRTAGRLVGHIYIHGGDDSGFVCEPW
jgi:hypothetical protein